MRDQCETKHHSDVTIETHFNSDSYDFISTTSTAVIALCYSCVHACHWSAEVTVWISDDQGEWQLIECEEERCAQCIYECTHSTAIAIGFANHPRFVAQWATL